MVVMSYEFSKTKRVLAVHVIALCCDLQLMAFMTTTSKHYTQAKLYPHFSNSIFDIEARVLFLLPRLMMHTLLTGSLRH